MRTGRLVAASLWAVLALAGPAFTQIAVEWELLPETSGDNLDVPYDRTEVKARDYRLAVGLPMVLSTSEVDGEEAPVMILTHSAFYSRKYLDVANWPEYSLDSDGDFRLELSESSDKLISFGYTASLAKTFSPRWSALGIAGFTYAGVEPDKYRVGDMGLATGVAAMHSWTSGWTLGLGLYYSRLTGSSMLLPLVLVQHQTERSALSITVPGDIAYWYHPNPRASVGLLAQLQGDMYTFVGQRVNQYDRGGQLESTDNKVGLAYSSLTLGPAVRVPLGQGFAAVVRCGVAMARRYQYWLMDEQEALRYAAHPDYVPLTGRDYSGDKVEFPIDTSAFLKVSLGLGL